MNAFFKSFVLHLVYSLFTINILLWSMGLFSVITFFVTSALDRSVYMILINYISIWIHLSCQFYIYICQYSFSFVWYLYFILWACILWTKFCLVIDQVRFWLIFELQKFLAAFLPIPIPKPKHTMPMPMIYAYLLCRYVFLRVNVFAFCRYCFSIEFSFCSFKKMFSICKSINLFCVCMGVCVCVFLRMHLLHNGSW